MRPSLVGRLRANRGHPLNKGRLAWWLGIPGYFHPHGVWLDMMGKYHLNAFISNAGFADWGKPRPGPTRFAKGFHQTGNSNNPCAYGMFNGPYPTGSGITMACWFYGDSSQSKCSVMGNFQTGGHEGPLLLIDSNNAPTAWLRTSTTDYSLTGSSSRPAFAKWHHFAMTYDGTTLRTFWNGTQDGSLAANGTVRAGNGGIFWLGKDDFNGTGSQPLGITADASVWDRPLSSTDIKRLITLTYRNYAGLLLSPIASSHVLIAPPATYLIDGGSMWAEHEILTRAKARRNIVYSLPPSWSIDPSQVNEAVTVDKYHRPLAIAAAPKKTREANLYANIKGDFGDIPRPIFVDPLPANAPVWHTPLAEPPRAKEKDRRLLMKNYSLGDLPRPEDISVDKWLAETRVPGRRRPETPPHADYATDMQRIGDTETVSVDRFYAPIGVVIPRRRPILYVPDSCIVQDEVFPEDPVAISDLPWHVTMACAARNVRTKERHEWFSDGGILLGVPGLILEDVKLGFHAPMGSPPAKFYQRRTPPLPIGGIDLEPTQRVERIFEDAFREMGLPAWVRRKAAPFFAATLVADTVNVVEQPHVEAFMMSPDVRRAVRRVLAAAWMHDQSPLVLSDNFSPPLIPRIRRWMLAAGLWRARY
jgi:hypothetical protein